MATDCKRVVPDGPDGDHDGQFSVLVDQLLCGVFREFFFEFHLWRVLVASQAVYTQLAPILVAILDELQDQKDSVMNSAICTGSFVKYLTWQPGWLFFLQFGAIF